MPMPNVVDGKSILASSQSAVDAVEQSTAVSSAKATLGPCIDFGAFSNLQRVPRQMSASDSMITVTFVTAPMWPIYKFRFTHTHVAFILHIPQVSRQQKYMEEGSLFCLCTWSAWDLVSVFYFMMIFSN